MTIAYGIWIFFVRRSHILKCARLQRESLFARLISFAIKFRTNVHSVHWRCFCSFVIVYAPIRIYNFFVVVDFECIVCGMLVTIGLALNVSQQWKWIKKIESNDYVVLHMHILSNPKNALRPCDTWPDWHATPAKIMTQIKIHTKDFLTKQFASFR